MRYSLGPQSNRVYRELRERVLSGRFTPGSRLPSQSCLAADLGVAPLTLRQALAQLEDEGLVSREQGRGTFVRPPPGESRRAKLASTTAAPDRFRQLIEHMEVGVLLYGLQGEVLVYNQASLDLLGLTGEQLQARAISDPAWRVIRADGTPLPVHEFPVARALTTRQQVRGVTMGVYRPTRQDWVWLQVNAEPCYTPNGELEGVINTFTDITPRRQEEEALRQSEERYRLTFDQAAIGIAHVSPEGRWLRVNRGICEMLGYREEQLLGSFFQDVTHPDDLPTNLTHFQGLMSGEVASYVFEKRYIRKDGSLIWANVTTSVVRNSAGQPQYSISIIEDITERKRLEERLRHQALHDALTDLPNRILLQDRLEQAIRTAHRTSASVALLLMDLDRFKEVNDTFGHHHGDLLLQKLGQRIQSVLRDSDTVARLGGDEFAVLLPGARVVDGEVVAAKILEAFVEPYELGDQSFDIDGSIGIATYPDHGKDTDTLLRHADVAMYQAKQHGMGYAVYLPAQDQYSPTRLGLITDLRKAIDTDHQLLLHYQPKVELRTGKVVGVEALVRWRHPRRGLIPPDQFIGLAEHTGLIRPLSLWVLEQALHQCRIWHDSGLDIHVAVNLSARNLTDPGLRDTVATLLKRHGVRPEWVKLELTESAIMTDLFRSLHSLTGLHEMGVQISIDDFGTGQSSLSYLKRLPITEIKIDRSFVKDMKEDDSDFHIVRATIGLGHDLGLRAVAEGIEDQDTCGLLTGLGCDLGQGYYLSRPASAEACTEWLRRHQGLTSARAVRRVDLSAEERRHTRTG